MPEKNSVFISSTAQDGKIATQLAEQLHARGVPVFFDRHEISLGASWQDEIEKALEGASTFVFLVSPNFLQSKWALFESGVALGRAAKEQDVTLIPVMLPGATPGDMPSPLRSWQAIDAKHSTPEQLASQLAEAFQRTAVRF